ncbi:hypothetical protein EV126DRAFT_405387 [Verticillium dahliae]|nr:hypothetical protein EV126DRAFT_405387 [Verticillium dahliae]
MLPSPRLSPVSASRSLALSLCVCVSVHVVLSQCFCRDPPTLRAPSPSRGGLEGAIGCSSHPLCEGIPCLWASYGCQLAQICHHVPVSRRKRRRQH